MNKKKEFVERDYNRISLIFAVFMANNIISYIVGQITGEGGIYIALVILGAVMLYCYKTMVKIKFPAIVLTLIILVTVYYLFTRQTVVTTVFGRYFLFCFLSASVLGMYKCNAECFLRYLTFACVLIIPFYTDIFIDMTSSTYGNHISMGLSYAMFPMLLAAIMHFIFYRKQSGWYMYIFYGLAAWFLYNLVLKGNRGILLSLVVFGALVFVSGMKFNRKKGVNLLKVAVVLIGTAFLIFYFYDILRWVSDLFDGWGIEANFLDKIIRLEKEGDVTNGRSDIFDFTIKGIQNSPLIGHGIGTIFYNSGYRIVYPHNVVLQLLYDGGLVLFIPVLISVVQAVYYAFMGEDRNEAVFALFLITICLPRMMVSGDIWESEAFWLFVMHSFKYYTIRKKWTKAKNQRDVVVTQGTLGEIADISEEKSDEVEDEIGD